MGKPVVVTSGTGSGKTECFMLPLLASLLEEAMSHSAWTPPRPRPTNFEWYQTSGQQRIAQRRHEARPAAVRALLIYPLNALVEDQLGRLRHACDRQQHRDWMKDHAKDNRIWFGRYNSLTPVPGRDADPGRDARRKKLREQLAEMHSLWQRCRITAQNRSQQNGNLWHEDELLDFFQDPSGAEMWSRWDMQQSPPDILITNYSMLNIMLMRSVETSLWDQTASWLQESPDNRFHLVVDELHTYRGTAGTEVAYLLRSLLHRIGLTPTSPQLRLIATSASLDDDKEGKGRKFLSEFFGRDPQDFCIVPGHPAPSQLRGDLKRHCRAFAAFDAALTLNSAPWHESVAQLNESVTGIIPDRGIMAETCLSALMTELGAPQAMRDLSDQEREPGLRQGTFTAKELADTVFPGDTIEERSLALSAARGVIRAVALGRVAVTTSSESQATKFEALIQLREHLFFHSIGRLWACVDAQCSFREREKPDELPPTVGKLYSQPVPRCQCGSIVMELLLCSQCGDILLGGYRKEIEGSPNEWSISPDDPDLDNLPDRNRNSDPEYSNYLVFWPTGKTVPEGDWADTKLYTGWQEGSVAGYKFAIAELGRKNGILAMGNNASNDLRGYLYFAPSPEAKRMPSRCPCCAENRAFGRSKLRTPLRPFSAGLQRVAQLLCDSLLRQLPDDRRKLVLFSDSRSDAAKLSTGIKVDHYFDTLRQVLYSIIQNECKMQSKNYNNDKQRHQAAMDFVAILQNQRRAIQYDSDNYARLASILSDDVGLLISHVYLNASMPGVLHKPSLPEDWAAVSLRHAFSHTHRSLITLGMNPGGVSREVNWIKLAQQDGQNLPAIHWSRLFDLYTGQANPNLNPAETRLQDWIYLEFVENAFDQVLAPRGGRDFESLGLGYLWNRDVPVHSVEDQAAASILRILALRRRHTSGTAQASPHAPQEVDKYLKAIAKSLAMDMSVLKDRVTELLLKGIQPQSWLIDTQHTQNLYLVGPTESKISVFRCERCSRIHMHASAGVCTNCLHRLPERPNHRLPAEGPENDEYYGALARSLSDPFPLQSQELTAQTDKEERRTRQRLFQNVMLDDENPKAQAIHLLSVTTTMEAGVDIGSLLGIANSNMPPMRFNYQQRVGRAGRRGSSLAVALTLCRGRSHDEHYYDNPWRIASDRVPSPAIDMQREEIVFRVAAKEMLFRALQGQGVLEEYTQDNVHGEFGPCSQWSSMWRPRVIDWIENNPEKIYALCYALTTGSSVSLEKLRTYISTDLLQAIDVAVSDANLQESALGKQLAYRGLLPMFGFPTRVRSLYLRPRNDRKNDTVEREIEIAIGQFAPGAQIVKDDRVYTAIGLVKWEKHQNQWQPNGEVFPANQMITIGFCMKCQGLDTQAINDTSKCRFCGEGLSDDKFRVTRIAQPPDFVVHYDRDIDFDGSFSFAPRSMGARLAAEQGIQQGLENFVVFGDSADIYRINDNGHKDFNFFLHSMGYWISPDAEKASFEHFRQRSKKHVPPSGPYLLNDPTQSLVLNGNCEQVALGVRMRTDVMLATLANVPSRSLDLNPTRAEARAAWYSLAYLLRRAAAYQLDISPEELEAGIQTFDDVTLHYRPSARVFLADVLENGAGYARALGKPDQLKEMLIWIREKAGLTQGRHENECKTSCYRCLREYGNMNLHALLDWRLGLDLVDMMRDADIEIGLDHPRWRNFAWNESRQFFEGMGYDFDANQRLPVGIDPETSDRFVITHPLWSERQADYNEALAEVTDNCTAAGFKVKLRSLFRMLRNPWEGL